MAEHIYLLADQGDLSEMTEERFDTEDALQGLIARHPELLAGEQIDPQDPPRFILVKREKGIAETSEATSARWAVDLLLIDQHAIPTLVEVKRGANPDNRRKVVGQMLDYAAHASRTWTAGDLRERFEQDTNERGDDPSELLSQLLGEADPDEDGFWDDVATHLAAKRLRLLFAADEIPDELARVVEFLNEQMPNIEVLAVEIKQFRGETGQVLVPRVIGRMAASPSRPSGGGTRTRQTIESLLDRFSDPRARSAAERLIEAVQPRDRVTIVPRGRSITIRVNCELWPQQAPLTIAWLCVEPGVDVWEGTRDFSFGSADRQYGYELEAALANRLDKWVHTFDHDRFAVPLPKPTSVRGHSVAHADAIENIDLLVKRLTAVVNDLAVL